MSDMRFDGKVAIVTGAGGVGNIGVAVARAFLAEGAKAVIGTDFRTDDVAAVMAQVKGDGHAGTFRLVQQDVTSEADWDRVIGDIVSGFGGLDVLVNNAGISIHGGIAQTVAGRSAQGDGGEPRCVVPGHQARSAASCRRAGALPGRGIDHQQPVDGVLYAQCHQHRLSCVKVGRADADCPAGPAARP